MVTHERSALSCRGSINIDRSCRRVKLPREAGPPYQPRSTETPLGEAPPLSDLRTKGEIRRSPWKHSNTHAVLMAHLRSHQDCFADMYCAWPHIMFLRTSWQWTSRLFMNPRL